MGDSNFYNKLPPIRAYARFPDDEYFRDVPPDWTVLITDIRNSTEAVRQDRYREVNVIGAASIVVTRNILDTLEFPFIFGGDGSTILLPQNQKDPVLSGLSGLRTHAEQQFQLNLRVGSISVSELYDRGNTLEVGRYEIVDGQSVGIIRGDGIDGAEELIRNHPEKYEEPVRSNADFALDGLSCRWQPVESERGQILSLLVRARDHPGSRTYRNFISFLDNLYEGGWNEANPIHTEKSEYRKLSDIYSLEHRLLATETWWSWIKQLGIILLAVTIFRWNVRPFFSLPDRYQSALRSHSDFRKFDGTLQMTIDTSPEEFEQIKSYLSNEYEKGNLFYGLQKSSSALMTCFVNNMEEGGHLHFVDGSDGGYTMAAVQLKNQIAKNRNSR